MTKRPPLVLDGKEISFKTRRQYDTTCSILNSFDESKFPNLNKKYEITFRGSNIYSAEILSLSGINWPYFYMSQSIDRDPELSLSLLLSAGERSATCRAGLQVMASGTKSFCDTKTNFGASNGRWWNPEAIGHCLNGESFKALSTRKLKPYEHSTTLISEARMDDLESSLGIGRYSTIEIFNGFDLAQGCLFDIYETSAGFEVSMRLFLTNGTVSTRFHNFYLREKFKLAKRHLNGQWIEVVAP